MTIIIEDLAQEIRRVDGNNSLGSVALAEALRPYIERHVSAETPKPAGAVPMPEPYTTDQKFGWPYWRENGLQAYGEAREAAAVAPYRELLEMIASRARSFPNFPMGYHLPEVFKALGQEPPENDGSEAAGRANWLLAAAPLPQQPAAEGAIKSSCSNFSNNCVDTSGPAAVKQSLTTQGEVVAWIRFRSDGGWEGPIHDREMDDIRRRSDSWTPLGIMSGAQPTAYVAPAEGEGGEALASDIVRDVAELPDRSSPEDWPDAMLVTAKELQTIIARRLTGGQADA